ncbi:MAG: ABC transporter permease [Dehalococcoidia bacterium]|nr:ABC transporter permease [Dehalococcoidia bacterium]
MNREILILSLRQLLGKRRTLALVALALLPLLVALVFRAGDSETDPVDWTANTLLNGLIVTTVLPLVTLVLATTSLGMEIEDGTIVYLLSKPLSRAHVITAKLAASWLPAAALVSLSAAASAGIALQGSGYGVLPAFVIALGLGALAYSAVFLLLSLLTARALVVGLIYVFIWEGLVTELFEGTRILSVRQYTLGVADLLTNVRAFEANLDGVGALVLMALVTAIVVALTIRRLNRFETRTLF